MFRREDAKTIMSMFDHDGDGVLNYNEFVAMVQGKGGGEGPCAWIAVQSFGPGSALRAFFFCFGGGPAPLRFLTCN